MLPRRKPSQIFTPCNTFSHQFGAFSYLDMALSNWERSGNTQNEKKLAIKRADRKCIYHHQCIITTHIKRHHRFTLQRLRYLKGMKKMKYKNTKFQVLPKFSTSYLYVLDSKIRKVHVHFGICTIYISYILLLIL